MSVSQSEILIAVIIVLVLAVLGLVIFIMFPGMFGSLGSSGSKISAKIINQQTNEITSVIWPSGDIAPPNAGVALPLAHLESYPSGTKIEGGTPGNVTNMFRNGDLMAISATVPDDGGYGVCCIAYPSTPGNYSLVIYLNNNEAKRLNFAVVG